LNRFSAVTAINRPLLVALANADYHDCEIRLKQLEDLLTPEQLKEAQQLADERLKELKAKNPE